MVKGLNYNNIILSRNTMRILSFILSYPFNLDFIKYPHATAIFYNYITYIFFIILTKKNYVITNNIRTINIIII